MYWVVFFFQAEDGIRDIGVTGVQTCALPIYLAAKRPFEIAILRSAIPPSEWNTLDDVIATKIPENDKVKPWIWMEKIIQHYVGASTSMQDL